MDSYYYYFSCDARFNTSEEWNAHLNVCFFDKSIFLNVLNWCLYFQHKPFFHIFLSQMSCLAIFRSDMFEPV